MFPFRRSTSKGATARDRSVDKATPAAPVGRSKAKPGPADKAQALLAMLGDDARHIGVKGKGGKGLSGLSEAQLRKLAADLIQQVEKKPKAAPAATRAEKPAPPPPRRRVFSQPEPMADPAPAAAVQPADRVSPPPAPRVSRISPVAPSPAALSADIPSAYVAHPDQVEGPAPVLSREDVSRVIRRGADAKALPREHAAVVAWTLLGKPPLEQAAELRRLPSGQVRTVHRMLRQLQQGA